METLDLARVAVIAVVLFILTAGVDWILKKLFKSDSRLRRIIILTLLTIVGGAAWFSQYKNSSSYAESGLANLFLSFIFAWIPCLIVFSLFLGKKKKTMKGSGMAGKNNREKEERS